MKTPKTPEHALVSLLQHLGQEKPNVVRDLVSWPPFIEALLTVRHHFIDDPTYARCTVELELSDAEQMVEAMRKEMDALREELKQTKLRANYEIDLCMNDVLRMKRIREIMNEDLTTN